MCVCVHVCACVCVRVCVCVHLYARCTIVLSPHTGHFCLLGNALRTATELQEEGGGNREAQLAVAIGCVH